MNFMLRRPTMANLLAFTAFLLFFLISSTSADESPSLLTAHAELINHGFPVGLLPTNVKSYTLNHTSGDFLVRLSDTCKVTLPPDNYLASYSKQIAGKIVAGKIAEINGIRVWAFFQWWSITGIKSKDENLVFEVGMLSAKYPSNNFNEIPECEGTRLSSSS